MIIKIVIEPRWAAISHHGEIEITERELSAYKTPKAREEYIEAQVDAYVAEEVQYGWHMDEDELLPCGCPEQFVIDCGHQEGCEQA